VDNKSNLAIYITELYSNWEQNRRELEEKWQKNLDAFRCELQNFWKNNGEKKDWQSDTFVGLTRQKIITGYSLVMDILLQSGKLPFSLSLSPHSESEIKNAAVDSSVGMDAADDSRGTTRVQEMFARSSTSGKPQSPEDIDDAIARMKKLIDQQLREAKVDKTIMKEIMACAIYGEAFAKKTVVDVEHSRFVEDHDEWEYIKKVKEVPGVQYSSLWNIFRDLENDDLRESVGIIERQLVSAYWLEGLKHDEYSDSDAIARVIKTEKSSDSETNRTDYETTLEPKLRNLTYRGNNIRYLEFWGRVPATLVESFEKLKDKKSPNVFEVPEYDGREIEVMVCVAGSGDEIVRFARINKEDRPYYRVVWEDNVGDIGGTGIADNTEVMQKVVNGAMQAFEDNKKLSGNVIIGTKPRMIEDDDDDKGLYPGKEYKLAEECLDVRQALHSIVIPDVGASLLDVLNVAERYLDDSSMIPKISQGISSKGAATAYEVSIQNESAGKYMAGVVRNFDEYLIEPIVFDFYKENMEDPDVKIPKGDYSVKSEGFVAFKNKIILLSSLQHLLAVVSGNEFFATQVKPRELLESIMMANNLDPAKYMKTLEEMQALDEERRQSSEAAMQENAEITDLQKQKLLMEIEAAKANLEKLTIDAEMERVKMDIDAAKLKLESEKFNLERAKVIGQIEATNNKGL